MLGISARRAEGEDLPSIVPGSAAILELCDRARAEGRGFGRAISLPSPQRDFNLVLAARVSLTGEGLLDPVLVELFDITQRYQLDRENTLLTQHDVSRRIIRELAHEIRNPLGGLRGAAQLLERQLTDTAQREYTTVIIAEADRLAALMDRLLGPGRQPRMRPINIHEVLQRVATIVGSEWPQAEIIRDYDPSLPDLQADPDQLAQALLNLARNAAQATDGCGTIVLRTRVLTNQLINQANFRLVAVIEVEDDGAGVPEEIAETLFYPLVSGRSTGTGLGLPLAQDLVHRHHGLIEYESAPGRTVFAVQLPISAPDPR